MKQKLSKSARLAFIASLCGGLSASLAPSRHDVSEEVNLVTHSQDMGILPVDDDLPALPPSLAFETVTTENEEAILTAKERRHLAKEKLAYRIRQDLSAARNPYALALV